MRAPYDDGAAPGTTGGDGVAPGKTHTYSYTVAWGIPQFHGGIAGGVSDET
jgi:hypothetical protein